MASASFGQAKLSQSSNSISGTASCAGDSCRAVGDILAWGLDRSALAALGGSTSKSIRAMRVLVARWLDESMHRSKVQFGGQTAEAHGLQVVDCVG